MNKGLFLILFIFIFSYSVFGKTILILHSYHNGMHWTDELNSTLVNELRKDNSENEIYVEYMDTKRYTGENYLENLLEYLKNKYVNQKIDVIIVTDNAAYDFMVSYHKIAFPNVPIVFCGVNNVQEFEDGFTGVIENIDVKSNLSIILNLHPNYNKIYIITDRSLTGTMVYQQCKIAIDQSFPQLKYEFLRDYSFLGLKQKLLTLEKNDIVFLLTFNLDKNGLIISYDNILEEIKPYCQVPIYSTWSFYLNRGIVGGKITSAEEHAKIAASQTIQILHGSKTKSIPIVEGPLHYVFDKKVMEQFNISKRDLPPGSKIINNAASIIQNNPVLFGIIGLSFLLLMILVLLLFILYRQKNRRLKREKILMEEIQFQKEELSQALEKAEQSNKIKQAFLSNISHEIRTPLNSISGFTEIITADVKLTEEERKHYVSCIRENQDRLLSTIESILELAMIESGVNKFNKSDFNLHFFLKNIYDTFIKNNPKKTALEVRLNLDKIEKPILIYTDAPKLEKVINLLLNNAYKFTKEGYIELSAYQKEINIVIEVSDTGIGVGNNDMNLIFESFVKGTTGGKFYTGPGVGLAIAKSIILKLGGTISAHAQESGGSVFMIQLPIK